jgi:HSP20 family molecular chaperone IbpA
MKGRKEDFMAAMRAVGDGHQLPAHANVREDAAEYLIELDVADFTERELTVEALGPRLQVCGDQVETAADAGKAFRLHERLEESFRLPDDADADQITVFFKHGTLEIHVPRTHLEPRRLPIEHPASRINPDATAC